MNGSPQRAPETDPSQLRGRLPLMGPAAAGWYLSAAVFLGFLALYAATLLPGVLPADSGEFQEVAATAGVAHPPGYPLYTLLAWLFAHIPLGPTPAWRVNAFSAITAAATTALVFSTARRTSGSLLGGLAAALALGSATTFWATATKASIRPLTAFFAALCLYALIRHASVADREESSAGDRYLVLFFLALSLGLTHHPSLLFPGVVFLLYLILVDPALLHQPRRWLKPALALLPSLLVFIYLPLRGTSNLSTLSGFLDYVLARGFRGDMFALGLLDRLVLLPTLLRFQFNVVLLVGAGVGALLLLWRDHRLAFLLLGSSLIHTAVTLTYDAPQTVEYEMPAYVSLVFLMAVPFGYASPTLAAMSDLRLSSPRLRSLISIMGRAAAVLLLFAALANLVIHLPSYRALSDDHDARLYVETLLRDAPQEALILSNWHWFTPLRYVHEVEGVRPDITIEYVAPRGEPLAETWVRRIEEHVDDRPVVVVRFFRPQYSALPYTFEPLGEAFLVRSERRTDVPADLTGVDAVLGEEVEILGYRLGSKAVRPAQPLSVELAWSPASSLTAEIARFAQLIGPDGRLWSMAEDPRHAPDEVSPGQVVLDRILVYPRLDAPPGQYTLVVGAYTSEGRLTTQEGDDTVTLQTVRVEPSAVRPVTQHPRFLRPVGAPSLVGFDNDVGTEGNVRTYLHWAGPGEAVRLEVVEAGGSTVAALSVPALERGEYATLAVDRPRGPIQLVALRGGGPLRWNLFLPGPIELPPPDADERYVPFGDGVILTDAGGPTGNLEPGAKTMLPLRFRGYRPIQRDYIVSTSLTGLNPDGTWAWRVSHDTVPALGAVPTLKWIRGSLVLDPHRMEVPPDSPAVPVAGSVLIYDHFTQRSLPSLDGKLTSEVDLGTWRLSH